ncbi:MAG: 16S rRNA (guanine(527)-N(7))-methyltransferase RsmG [Clostridiales bacterium]|nr:16S rRNA (guanine(527)-N(7))-methyltransferase RsmG [Clostridiales bacterium]
MEKILIDGFKQFKLDVSDRQIMQLTEYARLLQDWNNKINLTAICSDEGIATKHFLDSASALLTGHVQGKVIDVGTGAGFPGLVLKILKPDIELTLLDSLNKRLNFLKAVSEEIGTDAELVHARAEDGGRLYRSMYDTVVARAVANMTVLSELCIPFLKVGGYFLALKGPLADEELEDAKRAIYILGGELSEVFSVKIPFTDLNHKIIIIKKVRQTPQQYPRKPGVATKTPIGNCYNLKKKPTK